MEDDQAIDSLVVVAGEEIPVEAWPVPRRRLFAILGWAAAGFVAVAFLASLLATAGETFFRDIGFAGAGVSVTIGLVVFAGVVWTATRMGREHRGAAQFLLWGTALVYAFLVNAFIGAVDLGEAEVGSALLWFVLASVLGVGGAVLLVLTIAIGIGFAGGGRLLARVFVIASLVVVPVLLVEPGVWWVGVLGGLMLAWAVEVALSNAFLRPDVPEPALAACLVAGVSAVVLLVIFLLLRFVLRFVAAVIPRG